MKARSGKFAANERIRPAAPRRRPGANAHPGRTPVMPTRLAAGGAQHPLVQSGDNSALFVYEEGVKSQFDSLPAVLKKVAALQYDADFERKASALVHQSLGFELPGFLLENAWVNQLDMRRLYAWCVFEVYRRFCNEFFERKPLGDDFHTQTVAGFQTFLHEAGYHTFDITPCSDGRLAHVIRYVLRLPIDAVRRRSYAGALFDIEDSMQKWIKTELSRYQQSLPTPAGDGTRYLKAVVYHYSSINPSHQGCAAHGSDDAAAARAGLERLQCFKEAIENRFCAGDHVDLLLMGLDTDTDAIQVHLPDQNGVIDLNRSLKALDLFEETQHLASAEQAKQQVADAVIAQMGTHNGMAELITHLVVNNFSQIAYVRQYFAGAYADFGHEERFIGAGIGFEEIQLRNLTYFAYLQTVEESIADLDVGIKIFKKLNVGKGLPVPVIVRFDYHGNVPGARERAIERCNRVATMLHERYSELSQGNLLHCLQVVRDCETQQPLEVLGSSVELPS